MKPLRILAMAAVLAGTASIRVTAQSTDSQPEFDPGAAPGTIYDFGTYGPFLPNDCVRNEDGSGCGATSDPLGPVVMGECTSVCFLTPGAKAGADIGLLNTNPDPQANLIEMVRADAELSKIYDADPQSFMRSYEKAFGEQPLVLLEPYAMQRALDQMRQESKDAALVAKEIAKEGAKLPEGYTITNLPDGKIQICGPSGNCPPFDPNNPPPEYLTGLKDLQAKVKKLQEEAAKKEEEKKKKSEESEEMLAAANENMFGDSDKNAPPPGDDTDKGAGKSKDDPMPTGMSGDSDIGDDDEGLGGMDPGMRAGNNPNLIAGNHVTGTPGTWNSYGSEQGFAPPEKASMDEIAQVQMVKRGGDWAGMALGGGKKLDMKSPTARALNRMGDQGDESGWWSKLGITPVLFGTKTSDFGGNVEDTTIDDIKAKESCPPLDPECLKRRKAD